MASTKLLLIFLMVVVKTFCFGTSWNTHRNRDLRATTTISYQCSVKGVKSCIDCSSFAYCMSVGTTAYKITCNSNQVCQNQNGAGSCVTYNDTKVTDCKCNSDKYVDDFYELTGNKYLICSAGQAPVVGQCPTGQVFYYSTSSCIPAPPIDCSQGGGPYLYGCIGSYFCPYPGAASNEAFITQCPKDNLFDIGNSTCVPKEQVKLANFTCGAKDGAVADTIECNAFYVCIAGDQQGEKICCPTGQFFSESTMQCTPDVTLVTCPSQNPCDIHNYTYVCKEPETTTSTTSTTTSTTTTTTTTTPTTITTTSTTPSTTTSTTTIPTSTTTTSTITSTPSTTSTTTPSTTSTTTTIPSTTSTTTTTPSTTTTSTTTTRNTCGLPSCSADGAFPNTCDCNKYYWCSGGKLTPQSCPSYLRFNAKLRYCTTPAEAGCA